MTRLSLMILVAGILAACDDRIDPCLPSSCIATRDYDAHAYQLRGRYDWVLRRLFASVDITVSLSTGASRVIELDSAVVVRSVRAGDDDLPFVSPEPGKLRVDLAGVAPAAEPVTFTVDYEARAIDEPGDAAFLAFPDADGGQRVVYTASEPDRGKAWLVAKHDPADRATWALELTVGAGDDVIANGRRVADRVEHGRRTVRYETVEPLPTYIMAFAAGGLETAERAGEVPLAVWTRPWAQTDATALLDMVGRQLANLEARLGPYPFERYAVVLLPFYPGGMENAGISFIGEPLRSLPHLSAHELAHQWFGDWVTMRTFDDAWVKEGMATLLEHEADPDSGGYLVPRLHGSRFGFPHDVPIVDRNLHGLDKYTSGTYRRAAWLITQIRALVGEDAFWATLRRILETYALDSIDGETFLRSFPLDDATADRMVASLEVRGGPAIDIDVQPGSGGTDVTFTMTDAAGVVFAPIEITVVDAAGRVAIQPLVAGPPLRVTVPDGGYVALDERDVHPWPIFQVEWSQYAEDLAPLFLPTAPAAFEAYRTRSAAHIERLEYIRTSQGLPPPPR